MIDFRSGREPKNSSFDFIAIAVQAMVQRKAERRG